MFRMYKQVVKLCEWGGYDELLPIATIDDAEIVHQYLKESLLPNIKKYYGAYYSPTTHKWFYIAYEYVETK